MIKSKRFKTILAFFIIIVGGVYVTGQDLAKFVGGDLPNQGHVLLRETVTKKTYGLRLDSHAQDTTKILQVACRMLGLRGVPSKMYTGKYSASKTYSKVLEVKTCSGDEDSIFKCPEINRIDTRKEYLAINCGYPSVSENNVGLIVKNQSSVADGSSVANAIDEDISKCFVSKQEKDPWISVKLAKNLFIHTITVTMGNSSSQNPQVLVYDDQLSRDMVTCTVSMVTGAQRTFKCKTWYRSNTVSVVLKGEDTTMTLCRVDIFAIDTVSNSKGTFLQAWKDLPAASEGSILKFNERFKQVPDMLQFLPLFDLLNKELVTIFEQTMKQEAYVMVTNAGSYVFAMACKKECELWFKRADEKGLDDLGTQEQLLIKYGASPSDNKYELSSKQNEKIQLSKCHLYHITVYTELGRRVDQGFTNLAIKTPGSATFSVNSNEVKELFYWTRPGTRELSFKITNDVDKQINLGSNLTLHLVYKFCCRGLQCPNCPSTLQLHVLDKTIPVNDSLLMDCTEYSLAYQTDVVVQPRNYSIQVSYSFVGDISGWQEKRTVVNTLQVTASTIYSCTFSSQLCQGWTIINNFNKTKREIAKRNAAKETFYTAKYFGNSSLESPVLPWTPAYIQIQLCVLFSYLLPTQTQSSLEVYTSTSKDEKRVWSIKGYQGDTWDKARIPVKLQEPFKVVFKIRSKINNTVAVAIRNFEVSTAACDLRPLTAEPEFRCPVTKYQCLNKQCVDKKYRCNGIKDGCIDGSDEQGCTCPTGYFTCDDGTCIDYRKLCNGAKDCKNGEDEFQCGSSCAGHQCFDGECVSGSCSSKVCEDKSHRFSNCGYCSSRDIDTCGEQRNLQCQTLRGICGFDNGPCGLTHLNSSFKWVFHSATGKDGYPSYDHSFEKEGSLYILKSTTNQTGSSQLTMKWIKTQAYCIQFWYIMSGNSDSYLEITIKMSSKSFSLWSMRGSTFDEWSFGQAEIPGNSIGDLVILGSMKSGYVALDDISFIEGGCSVVKKQDNPSCYFTDGKSCGMKIEGSWKVESGSKDSYVVLSQSKSSQQVVQANLTTRLIHPKTDGWRCLRFKILSSREYFNRELNVFFKNGDTSILKWSYDGVSSRWIFVQLAIPGNQDNLKVVFQGSKDANAILAIDDITFTKHQCQNIPDETLGQECQNYKILDSPERRNSELYVAKPQSDEILSQDTWYRITGAAGNEVHNKGCVSIEKACSSLYKGWINGSLPTVKEGQIKKQVCFSSSVNGCCKPSQEITVRNCGGYYVFKFPKLSVSEMKFCSSYRHDIEVKELSIDEEWRNWENTSSALQWSKLTTTQVKDIVQETKYPSQGHVAAGDVGFLLNSSATFDVPTTGQFKEMTLCFWISMGNGSSLNITVAIHSSGQRSPKITLPKTDEIWRHYCLTWTSAFGVYQVYVDGVATSEYSILLFDMETLNDPLLKVTFTSESVSTMRINNINVWNTVLSDDKILSMSYTCAQEKGNVIDWSKFNGIISVQTNPAGSVARFNSTTCTGKIGNVFGLIANTQSPSSRTATIVSPRYKRATESPERCLKFSYKLWGTGAKSLKLFQLIDGFPRRPIWIDDNNKFGLWREGHVTLSAVTEYKIVIEGETQQGPGLLSIGALHTTEEYCPTLPKTASKACNESLTSTTGYVISPYYPSYYSNDASCSWTIIAPANHEIRLEFKEFELEMSPRCTNDYVEVYDGSVRLFSTRIGRFCGVSYPPIIQSTSNNLLVVMKTNENVVRTGFKAFYRFIKVETNDSGCVQDCPADCVCHRRDGGIVLTSQRLIAVPDRLPKNSLATLFFESQIFKLESENFFNLEKLEFIDLSFNKILEMEKESFVNLPSLKALRLNRNFIRSIQDGTWVGLQNLDSLDLGENLLSSVGNNTFRDFKNLSVLSLRSNLITELDVDSFQHNTNLTYLYLHDNKIKSIISGLFRNQQKLLTLKLHSNKIDTFDKSTFTGLKKIQTLTLHDNPVKESTIPKDAFDDLSNLKHLTMDSFILCCYAKQSIPGLTCDSQTNSFSSCEDMLKNIVIRIGIWIQAILATLANISVIKWWSIGARKSRKKGGKADVQSWFLINLAMADFLMGIYLLIIAIQDAIFQGEYFQHDVAWRSGITCQITGAISTLSSEVSVMMLVTMTADRLNSIIFDFKAKRLNLKKARIICGIVWICGFLISFIPVFLPKYFFDQESGFSFYGRSTVCLPFQLSSEQPAGWEYSVGVFIVFNGAAIFFIFVSYTAIFIKVQKSAKGVRHSRSNSSSLGKRVIFVVMTDFCCWMPVIVIGILSLAGGFTDRTGQVYAWIAVLVLPINSSINPILYTFSTPQVLKRVKEIGGTHSTTPGLTQTITQGTYFKSARPKHSNTTQVYRNQEFQMQGDQPINNHQSDLAYENQQWKNHVYENHTLEEDIYDKPDNPIYENTRL